MDESVGSIEEVNAQLRGLADGEEEPDGAAGPLVEMPPLRHVGCRWCVVCDRSAIHVCDRCSVVPYCCVSCQTLDWETRHVMVCTGVRRRNATPFQENSPPPQWENGNGNAESGSDDDHSPPRFLPQMPGLRRVSCRSCVICQFPADNVCGHCGMVPYCTAICQDHDWTTRHSTVCHSLGRAGNPPAVNEGDEDEATSPAENPPAVNEGDEDEATSPAENPPAVNEGDEDEETSPAENPPAVNEGDEDEATSPDGSVAADELEIDPEKLGIQHPEQGDGVKYLEPKKEQGKAKKEPDPTQGKRGKELDKYRNRKLQKERDKDRVLKRDGYRAGKLHKKYGLDPKWKRKMKRDGKHDRDCNKALNWKLDADHDWKRVKNCDEDFAIKLDEDPNRKRGKKCDGKHDKDNDVNIDWKLNECNDWKPFENNGKKCGGKSDVNLEWKLDEVCRWQFAKINNEDRDGKPDEDPNRKRGKKRDGKYNKEGQDWKLVKTNEEKRDSFDEVSYRNREKKRGGKHEKDSDEDLDWSVDEGCDWKIDEGCDWEVDERCDWKLVKNNDAKGDGKPDQVRYRKRGKKRGGKRGKGRDLCLQNNYEWYRNGQCFMSCEDGRDGRRDGRRDEELQASTSRMADTVMEDSPSENNGSSEANEQSEEEALRSDPNENNLQEATEPFTFTVEIIGRQLQFFVEPLNCNYEKEKPVETIPEPFGENTENAHDEEPKEELANQEEENEEHVNEDGLQDVAGSLSNLPVKKTLPDSLSANDILLLTVQSALTEGSRGFNCHALHCGKNKLPELLLTQYGNEHEPPAIHTPVPGEIFTFMNPGDDRPYRAKCLSSNEALLLNTGQVVGIQPINCRKMHTESDGIDEFYCKIYIDEDKFRLFDVFVCKLIEVDDDQVRVRLIFNRFRRQINTGALKQTPAGQQPLEVQEDKVYVRRPDPPIVIAVRRCMALRAIAHAQLVENNTIYAYIFDFPPDVEVKPELYLAETLSIGDILVLIIESDTYNNRPGYMCIALHHSKTRDYQLLCTEFDRECELIELIHDPEPGEVFAYLYPNDGAWYRARRLNQFEASLIDNGRIVTICPGNCRKLPENYEQIVEFCCQIDAPGIFVGDTVFCQLKEKIGDNYRVHLIKDGEMVSEGRIFRWMPTIQSIETLPLLPEVVPDVVRPPVMTGTVVLMNYFDEQFFIRNAYYGNSNEIHDRLDELQRAGFIARLSTPPLVGNEVVVRVPPGIYCRALCRKADNLNDRYEVEFTEYGIIKSFPLDDMYTIPPSYLLRFRPTSVSMVRLETSAPLPKQAINYLNQLVINGTIIVLTHPGGDMLAESGSNVIMVLLDTSESLLEKLEEMIAFYKGVIQRNMFDEVAYINIPPEGGHMRVLDDSLLYNGCLYVCTISSITDTIISDLNYLIRNYICSQEGRIAYMPIIEEMCLAECPHMHIYMRAVMREYLNENKARVFFVDRGNSSFVRISSLRQLPQNMMQVPAIATLIDVGAFPVSPSRKMLKRARAYLMTGRYGTPTLKIRRCVMVKPGVYEVEALGLLRAANTRIKEEDEEEITEGIKEKIKDSEEDEPKEETEEETDDETEEETDEETEEETDEETDEETEDEIDEETEEETKGETEEETDEESEEGTDEDIVEEG